MKKGSTTGIPAPNAINIIGKRFSRLIVVERVGLRKGHAIYRCACDCGGEATTTSQSIREGRTQSCGCLQKERTSKASLNHGMSHTSIHNTWLGILSRCENPTNPAYKDYGARGITVCKEWHDFNNFYRDMGDKPKGLTLDRIDNDKGYAPANCRWATKSEQANNRRSNRKIEYLGDELTLAQWEAKLGLRKGLLHDRLKKGWSIKRALTTPTIIKYV